MERVAKLIERTQKGLNHTKALITLSDDNVAVFGTASAPERKVSVYCTR
jgi:hypothetical protein